MIPVLSISADVALFPAWQDGHPYHGPGLLRGTELPFLSCHASVSVAETKNTAADTGFDWRGVAGAGQASAFAISVEVPDGIHQDDYSAIRSGLPDGGWYILVMRFRDEATGAWRLLRFYYVALADDEMADGASGVMRRSLRFRAGWRQERVGDGDMPVLDPAVLGEVVWRCGAQEVVAWTFDPETETWTSLPPNETGDGSRYVQLAHIDGFETDIVIAAYLPRAVDSARDEGLLPRKDIKWFNQYLLRIGSHESAWFHGMELYGLNVQTVGIPEPLFTLPQARMIDEPVVVFRYLSRVYAVIGHGVLAVPSLAEGEALPVVHDPAFVLAAPGPVNPATGISGLVLLPDGAWLDGTLTP